MKYHLQAIPQVSVNEDEVILAQWLRNSGDYVEKRTAICEIETSKAVVEVEAEAAGYLFHLMPQNSRVPVGKPFAVLAEENDPTVVDQALSGGKGGEAAASARTHTKKAELLAKKHRINLAEVPASGGSVQEADVLKFLETRKEATPPPAPRSNSFRERLLVLGGGFGAPHIIDAIMRSEKQCVVGILDDNDDLLGTLVAGQPVLGPLSMLHKLWKEGAFDALILSFGEIRRRKELFDELTAQGLKFANVVDKTALIHAEVRIGSGNVLLANSRIGACSVLGDNNFLSAYVNLDHHNVLGSHCTFGPGVMSSGRVTIGDNIRFGTGIFIEPGLSIGSNSIIASGIVLTSPIPEYAVVKKQQDYKIKVQKPE